MGADRRHRTWLLAREPLRDRAALLTGSGQLVEYYEESADVRVRPGSIFAGIARDVVPAITAAFVEVGSGELAFLQAETVGALPAEGDRVLLQIAQGAHKKKSARASRELKLPGRFLVLTPGSDYVGVSKKIADEVCRTSLRATVNALVEQLVAGRLAGDQPFGVIVRSQAEQADAAALEAELRVLLARADQVAADFEQARQVRRATATLLYEELALPRRILRDRVCGGDEVLTANKALFDELSEALAQMGLRQAQAEGGEPVRLTFCPEEDDAALFERANVEEGLRSAASRHSALPSGGNIVIDHAEALTAIDVNSERFTGARVLEETAFITNREAAVAAAQQLRLRNLSGIIIVDFIEMRDPAHQNEVMRIFAEELAEDPARIHLIPLDELGLAKLTRKKQ